LNKFCTEYWTTITLRKRDKTKRYPVISSHGHFAPWSFRPQSLRPNQKSFRPIIEVTSHHKKVTSFNYVHSVTTTLRKDDPKRSIHTRHWKDIKATVIILRAFFSFAKSAAACDDALQHGMYLLNRNTVFNQSACICAWGYFLNISVKMINDILQFTN